MILECYRERVGWKYIIQLKTAIDLKRQISKEVQMTQKYIKMLNMINHNKTIIRDTKRYNFIPI